VSQFFRCEAPFFLRHEIRIMPSPVAQKLWTPPGYKLPCRLLGRTIGRAFTDTQRRGNLLSLWRLQEVLEVTVFREDIPKSSWKCRDSFEIDRNWL